MPLDASVLAGVLAPALVIASNSTGHADAVAGWDLIAAAIADAVVAHIVNHGLVTATAMTSVSGGPVSGTGTIS